ncbi:DUF3422 family protein [Parathalassolituus penaei]|uniref:DUF3422 domain-containing protein n=1 Tax=Parathalassolituus penaei TaxID=2997323 RepID=A0A9X3EFL9_9GAMM|nr:DUF3422 domain-containing protein [Parathalassolituus penaei]MCY0965854.1 DUF3422 domain-containing protein [Parathalassolituus penaei]
MSPRSPDIAAPALSLNVHPMRSVLYEELHNRPSPVIEGCCQVAHFTVKLNDNRQQLHAHVVELCRRFSVPAPDPESSCLYQDFGGFELRWERHLEFSNFTFIVHDSEPFAADTLAFIPKDWLANMPGELVVAVNLAVVDKVPDDKELYRWFEGQRVSGANVMDGKATVWTAFRLHSDGFGRILAVNKSMNASENGRLVQRLFELETYRLMSLLALPVARRMGNELGRVQGSLAQLNLSISQLEDRQDERELLKSLSRLAADVERDRSDTNFRFAAAVAYHDLVIDRLNQLDEQPIEGVQSFREFLERRLTPGIKTCISVRDQLEDLSRRIHRTTSMLRTRVELSIQEQNQNLLSSMNRRSEIQLRLQQTVEGLSVVVIGYYILALIGIGVEGLKTIFPWLSPYAVKGVALPIVLLLVYIGTRRLHHKVNKQHQEVTGDLDKPSGH